MAEPLVGVSSLISTHNMFIIALFFTLATENILDAYQPRIGLKTYKEFTQWYVIAFIK